MKFVFWQTEVSPHMAGLASALVEAGESVIFVAGEARSKRRSSMGWPDEVGGLLNIIYLRNRRHARELVKAFGDDAVHVVQGLLYNGKMKWPRSVLRKVGAKWGVVMETVNEHTPLYRLKRSIYGYYFKNERLRPDFVLAIGDKTPAWVSKRGYVDERIFSFAYFLSISRARNSGSEGSSKGPFRIGFVGRIDKGKRLDLLIDALCGLGERNYVLVVIGDGSLRSDLEKAAYQKLGEGRVRFYGTLDMDQVYNEESKMDCLVLPSDHDGWGAVVSESLLMGVPVVCSDACGSSVVVKALKGGYVFEAGNILSLRRALDKIMSNGRISFQDKMVLSRKAEDIGSRAGASYLKSIVQFVYANGSRPCPPWCSE